MKNFTSNLTSKKDEHATKHCECHFNYIQKYVCMTYNLLSGIIITYNILKLDLRCNYE